MASKSKVKQRIEKKEPILSGLEVCVHSERRLLITGIAAIAILLVSSIGLIYILGEVQKTASFNRLVQSLTHGSTRQSEAALDSYLHEPSIYSFVSSFVGSDFNDKQYERQIALENLYSITARISLNDFEGATLLFRDRVLPEMPQIISAMPLSQEDLTLLRLIVSRCETWSKNVLRLAELESNGPEQIEENNDRLNNLSFLAEESAASTAMFFGLQALKYPDGESMQFYKSGILEGLPKLRGLEDNIADGPELKLAIDRAGGKVNVGGPDAPRLFKERLEALKKATAVFRNPIEELKTENESITKEMTELRKSVYSQAQRVRPDVVALMEIVARPDTSTLARFINFLTE